MRAHGIDRLRGADGRRSVDDVAWFWDAVVRDLDIEFSTPYERVLDLSRGPEWATWFVGRPDERRRPVSSTGGPNAMPDAVAVIWEGEDGDVRQATYRRAARRLTDGVAASVLIGLGVEPGDRVALFLPMAIETVAALMACSKIGAVWVPIFSGFGPDAVAARIADAGCEVVVTANATLRKGAAVPMKRDGRPGCVARRGACGSRSCGCGCPTSRRR